MIRAKYQAAHFIQTCSEVSLFRLFHPWTFLPLSILAATLFFSNLCPPSASSHRMPILLSTPPSMAVLTSCFLLESQQPFSHPLCVIPELLHLRSLWQCISNHFPTSACLPSACLSRCHCQSLKFIVAKYPYSLFIFLFPCSTDELSWFSPLFNTALSGRC